MPRMQKAARISQTVMGMVFLVAGITKVWEPVLFYWNILPHTQLLGMGEAVRPLAARAALLLGPFECGLGLALITNWRPNLILPLAIALTAFFLGLMLIAWHKKVGVDCGCFGLLVERSPEEAAFEDVAMLGLLVFALWGVPRQHTLPKRLGTSLVMVGIALSLLIAGLRFFPDTDRLDKSDLQVGVRLTGLRLKGSNINLMEGYYFIELFRPDCRRCEMAVSNLNKWMEMPNMPPIIGLTDHPQNSSLLLKFKQKMQPRYNIVTIDQIDLLRLMWRHDYPRLAYVKNGVVQTVWEYYEDPAWQQIKNQIETNAPD